jgi:hypothetical protein
LKPKLVQPHPLYRNGGALFDEAGWSVFLNSRSGNLYALDAIRRSDGRLGFRLFTGEAPLHWRRVLRNAIRRRSTRRAEYETRIAVVPPLHLSFVWLAHEDASNDIFVP